MQNYLSILIPEELQQFSKVADIIDGTEPVKNNFGVQTIIDKDGNITGTEHYSASGELIKKVYYKGSSVSTIEHYRNSMLYSQEKYDTGKIIQKTLYNSEGNEVNVIKYKYNRENQIVFIQKQANNTVYSVEYGYDELKRVNSRNINAGSKTISKQLYRYDILDRIVEYKDDNQSITVHKVNPNNELISYTIRDVIGNKIEVNNRFICSEYIGTEISVNGHKTSVKDKMYINNVVLKKPYTNEDDLDFALSEQVNVPKINHDSITTTNRNNDINTDKITDILISNKKENINNTPFSADKIKFIKF